MVNYARPARKIGGLRSATGVIRLIRKGEQFLNLLMVRSESRTEFDRGDLFGLDLPGRAQGLLQGRAR